MKNKKIIVITGPTAVGKSDVAVKVAQAIDAEIISADSSQVYKGFYIGSGKITENEMENIPHYMLDILNFDEDFNVALFKQYAEEKIFEILNKNKNVIICGGTGLYIKALVEGFKFFNVSRNENLRAELEQIYLKEGTSGLYELLKSLNPAKEIDKNNKIRLIRAIEIEKANAQKVAFEKPKYSYQIFVLNSERNKLYERINKRVEKMFQDGLENEVRNLIFQGANLSHSSFKSIGYKELYAYIVNNKGTLDEAEEKIKQAARKYAKRQLTWFRSVKNAIWIDVKDKEDSKNQILKHIK